MSLHALVKDIGVIRHVTNHLCTKICDDGGKDMIVQAIKNIPLSFEAEPYSVVHTAVEGKRELVMSLTCTTEIIWE